MSFELDNRLSSSSFKIYDSTLSEVRLKNNKHYPWIILIPRVENNVTEIFQLTTAEKMELMREISHISSCIKNHFNPDKINVGALGNIVSQLHIHIIARNQNDLLWPHSVWQSGLTEENYTADEANALIETLREKFK